VGAGKRRHCGALRGRGVREKDRCARREEADPGTEKFRLETKSKSAPSAKRVGEKLAGTPPPLREKSDGVRRNKEVISQPSGKSRERERSGKGEKSQGRSA